MFRRPNWVRSVAIYRQTPHYWRFEVRSKAICFSLRCESITHLPTQNGFRSFLHRSVPKAHSAQHGQSLYASHKLCNQQIFWRVCRRRWKRRGRRSQTIARSYSADFKNWRGRCWLIHAADKRINSKNNYNGLTLSISSVPGVSARMSRQLDVLPNFRFWHFDRQQAQTNAAWS